MAVPAAAAAGAAAHTQQEDRTQVRTIHLPAEKDQPNPCIASNCGIICWIDQLIFNRVNLNLNFKKWPVAQGHQDAECFHR